MAFYQALPWHEGEDKIHALTKVPEGDNPTHPMLSQNAARRVSASPTIALGTVDDQDRVWCTLWGGDAPIAQQVARGGVIGIRTEVDASFDPVVEALYGGRDDGEVVRQEGKMVSGLGIHLEERDRMKLFGVMIAGSLTADEGRANKGSTNPDGGSETGQQGWTGNAQLVLQITQSLGNCPKYLNKKVIESYQGAKPRLVSDSPLLTKEAVSHIHSADLFFVASRGPEDMDCNHRGGPPGFLRVQPPTASDSGSVLVWPEYSGNNLYQTLGNIVTNPSVGLVIPNFINGNVLYLTGHAEVLIDNAATSVIQKTKLAVRLTVTAARFVHDGLTFRGVAPTDNKDVSSSRPITTREITDGMSPYNPRVRYLTSELNAPSTDIGLPPDEWRSRDSPSITATLTKKTKLTPTITKYRFRLTSSDQHSFDPSMSPLWKPGQYVALDFSDELYMGYSHMRDDDPTALNDDFIRTFTVASQYTTGAGAAEFEIVVRNVGAVTKWLSYQNDRSGTTKIGVRGFGGDFSFAIPAQTSQERPKQNVFIAAGIGITPLLGQLGITSPSPSPAVIDSSEDNALKHLIILWTLHVRDIGLLAHILPTLPADLRPNVRIFITGTESEVSNSKNLKTLADLEKNAGGVVIERRRLTKEDLARTEEEGEVKVENWYLCTAPRMRKEVQEWLGGRSVVFENFDY
ncbi:hypothetical protein H2198_005511 [Neophaeococcomyces mojaviensis]|uniref:Uncharacterized protein n=1 Tax=Neophaeococcomyces mojaviensis TaxID=3383035 RepID=A0ACC3A5Z1_9EURO|nr:hypothetical protein H2198_005511 [Knufia sp. JES_112]